MGPELLLWRQTLHDATPVRQRRFATHLQHGVVGHELGADGGRAAQEAAVVHLLHRLADGQHLRMSLSNCERCCCRRESNWRQQRRCSRRCVTSLQGAHCRGLGAAWEPAVCCPECRNDSSASAQLELQSRGARDSGAGAGARSRSCKIAGACRFRTRAAQAKDMRDAHQGGIGEGDNDESIQIVLLRAA